MPLPPGSKPGVAVTSRRLGSLSSDQPCNIDRRASVFNVLGARLCNSWQERREGSLGCVGEGEWRVSVSADQPCNVDRLSSDFNVLGAELCDYRSHREGRLGLGEGEKRGSI